MNSLFFIINGERDLWRQRTRISGNYVFWAYSVTSGPPNELNHSHFKRGKPEAVTVADVSVKLKRKLAINFGGDSFANIFLSGNFYH